MNKKPERQSLQKCMKLIIVLFCREIWLHDPSVRNLVGHIQAGTSLSNVAILFGITKQAVYNILKKYGESDRLKDRPRSGCPRVTDNQTDCDVVVAFRNRPFKTVQSAATDLGISRRTVSTRLASAGLKAYRPAIKPKLTEKHKFNRLHWADEHMRWTSYTMGKCFVLWWGNVRRSY